MITLRVLAIAEERMRAKALETSLRNESSLLVTMFLGSCSCVFDKAASSNKEKWTIFSIFRSVASAKEQNT